MNISRYFYMVVVVCCSCSILQAQTDLSGSWTVRFDVTVANGECQGEQGVTERIFELDHDLETGMVSIVGPFGGLQRTVQASLEEGVLSYDETFPEDGGFTHSVVRMTVAGNGSSMDGTEDWEWGPVMGGTPSCPNSKAIVTAEKNVQLEVGDAHVSPPIQSFLNEFRRFMGTSVLGRRLLSLVYQHESELFTIFVRNPEIGGEAVDVASSLAGISPKPFGLEFGGGELSKTYEALRPGVSSVLTGEGEEMQLTQAVIDQVMALRNLIMEEASPELKAEIELETQRLAELNLVDKSFDEAVESVGVDSQEISIQIFDPEGFGDEFSMKVSRVEGMQYFLWKSPSLASDSWSLVSDATQTQDGYTLIVRDPNPGNSKTFYRLQREVEQSGIN